MGLEQNRILIDATDKILGRLATKIALILQGKTDTNFAPHKEGATTVVVINSEKLKTTGKKFQQKKYYHHTGWPGGIKEKTLKELFEKDPCEVLKKAVWGMLPKNKLRVRRMKRLKMYRGEASNSKAQMSNAKSNPKSKI